MMKKKKIIGLSLIVLVVALAGWGLKKYYSHSDAPKMDPVWVQVTKVQQVSLARETKAIGTLVAAQHVEITPEVAGHVEHIYFKDGAFVKQGAVLIQLDDAIYRAKKDSATAQLSYSENNYKRMLILGKQGAIAKQAIDQAEAELKEKKANAQEAEVMVNKMKLIAPFDGIVGKSKVNLGDYVTITNSVATLTDTKHLRIEYNVPEKYLSLLKIGQAVKITTAAYPNKIFLGKVAFISPPINSDNRSVALYADVANEEDLLAAGMLVEVTQSLGTEIQVLMVPARSLVPVLDGEQVYTVVEGKALAVPVVIGQHAKNEVQIIRGLSLNATVITDGQQKVKNGTPVKVKI